MNLRSSFLIVALVSLGSKQPVHAQFFGPEIVVDSLATGANSMIGADLDRDGRMDLVGTKFSAGQVVWYRQLPSGNFSSAQVISTSNALFWHCRVADFDGDSDLDVVSNSITGTGTVLLENLGGGLLWKETILGTTGANTGGLAIGDLDSDGDMDVVAASSSGNRITIFRNDGSLSFSKSTITIPTAWALAIFDDDGDGDVEIFVGQFFSDTISRLENLGSGTFGAPNVIGVADGPSSLLGHDLDGDGDLDLLSAARMNSVVAWFENTGLGSFGPPNNIAVDFLVPFQADAFDMDFDGDLDVFIAAAVGESLGYLEGLGAGSFGPSQVINSVSADGRYVSFADIDGNGANDILSTSFQTSTFSYYETPPPANLPKITSVVGLHSIDSGSVQVVGENLAGVSVSVEGLPTVVQSGSDTQFTINLSPDEPGGLRDMKLQNSSGTSDIPKILPRYPVLEIEDKVSLGQSLDLLIDNGDVGIYGLAFSGKLFPAPAPFPGLGWYHGLELNGLSVLASGFFTPGATSTVLAMPAITNPALIGVTIHLQAWTTQSTLGYAGFTAVQSVTIQ